MNTTPKKHKKQKTKKTMKKTYRIINYDQNL